MVKSAVERMAGSAHDLAGKTACRRGGPVVKPSSEISTEEYADRFKEVLLRKFGTPVNAFKLCLDRDGSGTITKDEFVRAYNSLGVPGRADVVFDYFDDDKGGSITSGELMQSFQNSAGRLRDMSRVVDPNEATRTGNATDAGILAIAGKEEQASKGEELLRVAEMRKQLADKLALFQKAAGDPDTNVRGAAYASERIESMGTHRTFVDHEKMGSLDTIMLTTSFSELTFGMSGVERETLLDLQADVEISEMSRGVTVEELEPWEGDVEALSWSQEVEKWYTPADGDYNYESPSHSHARKTGIITEARDFNGMHIGVWSAGDESHQNEGFVCGRLVGTEYCYFALICGYGSSGYSCRMIIEDSLPKFIFRGSSEVPEMLRSLCKNVHCRLRQESAMTLLSGASIEIIITRGASEAWICSLGECLTTSATCGSTYAESVQQVTKKHIPADPEEFLRVTANPNVSEVENVHGVNRVFATGCAYPGVTLTRGLGNGCATEICNVLYEPMVVHVDLDAVDFLICASRGVTDKLSIQTMCTIAMHSGNVASTMPNLSSMAVAEDAATRWRNRHCVAHECSAMVLIVHPDNFTGHIPAAYQFGGREGSAVDVVRRSVSGSLDPASPQRPRMDTDLESAPLSQNSPQTKAMSPEAIGDGGERKRASSVQFLAPR
jgi:serine/threonine protein phosphatase PrpC